MCNHAKLHSPSPCLSPPQNHPKSVLYECVIIFAAQRKNNWHPAICFLVGDSVCLKAGLVSAARIVAKQPKNTGTLLCFFSPRWHLWVSSASVNTQDYLGRMWVKYHNMVFLLNMRWLCSGMQQLILFSWVGCCGCLILWFLYRICLLTLCIAIW